MSDEMQIRYAPQARRKLFDDATSRMADALDGLIADSMEPTPYTMEVMGKLREARAFRNPDTAENYAREMTTWCLAPNSHRTATHVFWYRDHAESVARYVEGFGGFSAAVRELDDGRFEVTCRKEPCKWRAGDE